LQHLNFSGILHIILAHVAWIIDISMDIYHMDSWKILHLTRMVNQGLQVSMMLIIACLCHDCDCTCMLCIV